MNYSVTFRLLCQEFFCKIEIVNLEQIFEKVISHGKNSPREWNLDTLESFIVSFEKNSQAANEELARNYGNIIKDIVANIQLRDGVLLENDSREQQLLREIMTNSTLFSMFNKLYVLLVKAEKQRVRIGVEITKTSP